MRPLFATAFIAASLAASTASAATLKCTYSNGMTNFLEIDHTWKGDNDKLIFEQQGSGAVVVNRHTGEVNVYGSGTLTGQCEEMVSLGTPAPLQPPPPPQFNPLQTAPGKY